MATKVDAAAAKQRQQKIILVVGGVLLAGLVALQGPKLLNHKSSSSQSATPAVETTPTTTGGTTSTGGTTVPAVVSGTRSGQAAEVAGVIIRPAGAPAARTGQLWSLSRFKPKDPFVQQVSEATGSPAAASGPTASSGGGSAATPGGVVVTPSTSTPVALGYATLMVNGKPQQLGLKDVFPKGQPTFVLIGVGRKFIKIGVAGGKFTGGGAVKLQFGKAVTLMNTTTGQRFVMKLVFTGAQPEQIAGFKQPAATATPATSTQTTTASAP
jgi:hypothetical protein